MYTEGKYQTGHLSYILIVFGGEWLWVIYRLCPLQFLIKSWLFFMISVSLRRCLILLTQRITCNSKEARKI